MDVPCVEEGEEVADVVGVEVREEYSVDALEIHMAFEESCKDEEAAVEERTRVTLLEEVRGRKAIPGRSHRAGSKDCQTHVCTISVMSW